MGLPESGRADQHERAPRRDEAIVEVAHDHLAVQLGAQAKVEFVARFLEGEGGLLEAAAVLVVVPREEFLLEEPAQEVGVRHLGGRRAVEPVLVDLADARELELRQHLVHQPTLPPWTKAS
ncbi:MAG: hypothetical protein U0807_10290 [Candidatus Binatia bacterium]